MRLYQSRFTPLFTFLLSIQVSASDDGDQMTSQEIADQNIDNTAEENAAFGPEGYPSVLIDCIAPVKCDTDKGWGTTTLEENGDTQFKFDVMDGHYDKVPLRAQIPKVNDGKTTDCWLTGLLKQNGKGGKTATNTIKNDPSYMEICGDMGGVTLHCGEDKGQVKSHCP